MADTLREGEKLQRGQALTSPNGAYTVTLQDDGNLVLAERGRAVWATGTDGEDVVRAEVQKDGNFVLYTPDKPVWHSDTKGAKHVRLVLQDDRNLVLYADDKAAWSSGTQTDAPPPPPVVEPAEPAEPASTMKARTKAEHVAQEPPPAPPAPAPPAPRTYTVVSGDTLWAIAERFYGDGAQYQRIADASGVANPDLIHPGQVLTIP
ncbi:LysM peptidoglycan-binding domain-containing protein [Mycobacterium sp. Y57]|uniref:LysM peptidoglycan-binding domain-containing protein n=1 Tax=Mycolicibacterium xanthum TaxID=2796469 RepID=UPI001C85C401|nr:LysM peptidoglycan-binding domain-containing protein [Mycolicibacterium xanthum]MBX7435292.1 LysM peptidoglycan-binding domain-containing protein [Mycolicibacterium xanthum]